MTIREVLKSLFTSSEVQSLAEKTLAAIEPLRSANPAIDALASSLTTAVNKLKKARKNGMYNTHTERVMAADEVRDLAFRAFRMYVEAASIRQNDAIAQAAKSLLAHMKKYDSKLIYLGYSAQTAELNLFVAEMDNVPEYVTGCNGMEWLDELKTAQQDFEDVQGGKVDEEVEKSLLVPTHEAKENTLQQLIALTSTLNGLEMAGIEGVAEVNQKVDQVIEQIEIPARARKTRRTNSNDNPDVITE